MNPHKYIVSGPAKELSYRPDNSDKGSSGNRAIRLKARRGGGPGVRRPLPRVARRARFGSRLRVGRGRGDCCTVGEYNAAKNGGAREGSATEGVSPMAGGGDLLLVIDVQQGFLNRHTEPVVGAVLGLLGRAKAAGVPLAFTRFVNTPGSAYERWIGWSGLMAEPGTLLAPPLELHAARGRVFVKHGYTAFTDAFAAYVRDQGVTRLFVCGVDTDCCVLKTAVDGFERGIEPVVLADACASHAGVEAHETGLRLLRRLIGGRQVRSGAASFP